MGEVVQRVAMKAVIVNDDGKVLILREASTYDEGTQVGTYQVPGGRINPGENFEEALKREVHEETGLEVELQYPIYVGEWSPVIKGIKTQIIATFIICKPVSDKEIVLSSEHDSFEWIKPSDHKNFDLVDPYDRVFDAYIARVK